MGLARGVPHRELAHQPRRLRWLPAGWRSVCAPVSQASRRAAERRACRGAGRDTARRNVTIPGRSGEARRVVSVDESRRLAAAGYLPQPAASRRETEAKGFKMIARRKRSPGYPHQKIRGPQSGFFAFIVSRAPALDDKSSQRALIWNTSGTRRMANALLHMRSSRHMPIAHMCEIMKESSRGQLGHRRAVWRDRYVEFAVESLDCSRRAAATPPLSARVS